MGEIGIFNESVGWTNVALAKADTEKILKTKFARSIKVYNDKAIGNFAKKNTADNKLDIISLKKIRSCLFMSVTE